MDGARLLQVESEIVALGLDHKEIKGVGLEFFVWKRCLGFLWEILN
ncbi:hypothetical protein NC653_036388 [Populus alba x Populus x berolinensis]|uniref:Uncharacterized protein n=1 Tax=Populus alba x Populus x berolinensis TaxID=444605 RepID=A0AAD6LJZ3_9ROSI|nr:hypothetical protein NC653_036381 [Populus alba x Populus x berolinensis]KAJ6968402.1 hypothetical protein NC653_036388 [Populus alba x Populus x berolinensis]